MAVPNPIERGLGPSGVGFVTGAGVAGQVAFWDGTSSIAGSASFLYDDVSKILTVNGSLRLSSGTKSIPSYTWVAEPTFGFYRRIASLVSLTNGTTVAMELNAITGSSSKGLRLSSDGFVSWGNAVDISTEGARDLFITRDAANSLGQRNGVNAQTFSVYNTYTAGTPDYERLEFFWTSNIGVIRAAANGTGTARSLAIRYGNTASTAITFGTGFNGGIAIASSTGTILTAGLVQMASGTYTAASGNSIWTLYNGTFSDGAVNSTTNAIALSMSPTINYTGATRTGKVVLAYFNPTLTSVPTGTNAGISFSSAFTNASFPAMRFFNTADEDTNAEFFEQGWHVAANTYTLRANKLGTGAQRVVQLCYSGTTVIGINIPNDIANTMSIASGGATSTPNASGRIRFSSGSSITATSGTHLEVSVVPAYAPTSTSTMAVRTVSITPTVNYSAGTPGAGSVYCVYLSPTLTSQPTGQNGGIVFSSAFTSATFPAFVINNQADEATNYEKFTISYTSNVVFFTSVAGGTGTVRDIQMTVGNAAASAVIKYVATSTIVAGVTDGYTAGLRLTPTYNAATAQTVTRHNYIDANNPVLGGAGPAALTDACLVRYDAAPGTHKAVDSGTTKSTPGTVDAWEKRNVNGTIYYVPLYLSKTT